MVLSRDATAAVAVVGGGPGDAIVGTIPSRVAPVAKGVDMFCAGVWGAVVFRGWDRGAWTTLARAISANALPK